VDGWSVMWGIKQSSASQKSWVKIPNRFSEISSRNDDNVSQSMLNFK
jgi:hypothetical protein